MNVIIRVPALVYSLRCPDRRCGHPFDYVETAMPFRGALKCPVSRCRTRWFAEPLVTGNVRDQLFAFYDDPRIVGDLVRRFRLPELIEQPMYFQIPLSQELWSGYLRNRDAMPRQRIRQLVAAALLVL